MSELDPAGIGGSWFHVVWTTILTGFGAIGSLFVHRGFKRFDAKLDRSTFNEHRKALDLRLDDVEKNMRQIREEATRSSDRVAAELKSNRDAVAALGNSVTARLDDFNRGINDRLDTLIIAIAKGGKT